MEVAKEGLVTVASHASSPVVVGIALVGVFAVEAVEATVQDRQAQSGETTILVVNQTIDGKTVSTVFEIPTGRTLLVAMNGQFVQTIQPRRITITVQPDTDSTIVITDAADGQVPYARATVQLKERSLLFGGDHSHVDLDSGDYVGDQTADLSFALDFWASTTRIFTENGAEVTPWTTDNVPSLAICQSIPADRWSSEVITYISTLPGKRWCVRTSEERYGAMEMVDALKFDYVVWKKSDDS